MDVASGSEKWSQCVLATYGYRCCCKKALGLCPLASPNTIKTELQRANGRHHGSDINRLYCLWHTRYFDLKWKLPPSKKTYISQAENFPQPEILMLFLLEEIRSIKFLVVFITDMCFISLLSNANICLWSRNHLPGCSSYIFPSPPNLFVANGLKQSEGLSRNIFIYSVWTTVDAITSNSL